MAALTIREGCSGRAGASRTLARSEWRRAMFNAMISPMPKRWNHFPTQSVHCARAAIRCESGRHRLMEQRFFDEMTCWIVPAEETFEWRKLPEKARLRNRRRLRRSSLSLLWADCVEPYSNSRRVDEPRVDETAAIIGAVVERCARGDIALTEIFIDPELAEFLGLANGRPLPHGSGPTVRCEAGLRRQVLFRKA